MSKESVLDSLRKSVINGNAEEAKRLAEEAISKGLDPVQLVEKGLSEGMKVIGEQFEKLEIFLPSVVLAADAMKSAMEILRPKLASGQREKMKKGLVVIGTCYGDVHDIGKNFVSAMLEAAGYEVRDLGTDVPVHEFINKAKEVKADIIGLSALLSTSAWYQRDLINNLKELGIRDKHWVIVGGGATTPEWVKEIGADGYGKLTTDAVKLCNRLVSERPTPPLHEPVIME